MPTRKQCRCHLNDNSCEAHGPVRLAPNWAGEFTTFDDWVNNARRDLAGKLCDSSTCTYPPGIPAICVDVRGRRCVQGSDFARARDEGCFPVRYFWDCKVA
jgi:hypothetical protein